MEILQVNMPLGLGINTEVIERMEKARLSRAQEDTRQQLEIINNRVKNIFEDYELGETLMANQASLSNVEFVGDMQELQSILGDAIKKSKYQQKVTIFIVGFQDICNKRVELLSQISEFFEAYSSPEEVEDFVQDSLAGVDVEAIQSNIQTALSTMNSAVTRLGELNHDIMGYLSSMQSAATSKSNKSRKKLEKSLTQAKEDISKMTEKLQIAQRELSAKEEQLQKLSKKLDDKSMELVNYKTQLEKARKNMVLAQQEFNKVQFLHEDEMNDMKAKISNLEDELQLIRDESAISFSSRIKEVTDASLSQLEGLRDRYNSPDEDTLDIKKELVERYLMQTQQIQHIQNEELETAQDGFKERVSRIMEIEISEDDIQNWGIEEKDIEKEPLLDNDGRQSETPAIVTPASVKDTSVSPTPTDKGSAESSRLHSTSAPAINSALEPVKELLDSTDEDDENTLGQLSSEELRAKYMNFRAEANNQLYYLQTKQTQATDDLLEKQRLEKKKWKEERVTLLDHIQQLQRLQEEAEADADEAMRQLEDLATQHELENEDSQRGGIENDRGRMVHSVEPPSSAEPVEEDFVKVKEQSTSPEAPKPLSSVSKKSVASLVEEKRAAMQRRRESATRLVNSASGSKLATPNIRVTDQSEAYENFAKCYRTILDFQSRVTAILMQNLSGENFNSLKQRPINVPLPDENETEAMTQSVEETLSTIESVIQTALESIPMSKVNDTLNQQSGYIEDELRTKVAELEGQIQLMQSEFGRRVQHDAAIIQHLQNTMSSMKQDNGPGNISMTTNTPSATAPVPSDHLLTVSQGRRGHTVDPSMTMMFTRLDSEHNTKTLMKSTKNGKINQSTLDSLVATMEGYNDVAGLRLHHLVRKLVHHTKMKEIEMNVRNSNLVTSEVFDILDKMEELQRRRAQNWSRDMDELNARRKRLGMLLHDAMQKLEKITGVFLIKPILSYRGKTRLRKYSGKISTRFNKFQEEAMAQKDRSLISRGILSGDAVKFRTSQALYSIQPSNGRVPWTAQPQPEKQDALSVSGLVRSEELSVWKAETSLPHSVPQTKKEKWSPSSLSSTMPRLLEIDVNRYLHEINTIHTFTMPKSPIHSPKGLTSSVRTYAGISRTGTGSEIQKLTSGRASLSRSGVVNTSKSQTSGEADYQSTAPPTTPASQTQLRRGSSGTGLFSPTSGMTLPVASPNLPKPLPPIQVPSRSRASTRSSLTPSPVKDSLAPSPTKSVTTENLSPLVRSKSEVLLHETNDLLPAGQNASPSLHFPVDTA